MNTLAWLAWIILLVVTAWGTISWLRRQGELLAPLPIALLTLGFYVLPRAAYLLSFGQAPLTSEGLPLTDRVGLIAYTLSMTCLAGVAFLVGHTSRGATRAAERSRFDVPKPAYARALVVSGACFGIGTLALAYVVVAGGGLHQLAQGQRTPAGGASAALFQLPRLLVAPVALLIVNDRKATTRAWVWLLALLAVLAVVPLGRRSYILLAALYPVGLYHLCVRRIRVRTLTMGFVIGAAVLFSFSYIRLLGARRIWEERSAIIRNPQAALRFVFATGELKIFDAETIVLRDAPQKLPYDYGLSFARVPAMLVPRSIWPTKPVTLGEVIVSEYLPWLRTGYPPTAVGALFAAAGAAGVVIGFLLLGWMSRVAWEWHRRHRGAGNASVYIAFSYFVYDFVRVGDPGRTVWFFLIGCGFLVTAFAFAAPPAIRPGTAESLREETT